jgi:hypothetical protein
MKITFSEDEKIQQLQECVDWVLEALGHPEALVTDQSMINDFADYYLSVDEKDKWAEEVGKKLSLEVKRNDYVWEVAERYRNLILSVIPETCRPLTEKEMAWAKKLAESL